MIPDEKSTRVLELAMNSMNYMNLCGTLLRQFPTFAVFTPNERCGLRDVGGCEILGVVWGEFTDLRVARRCLLQLVIQSL